MAEEQLEFKYLRSKYLRTTATNQHSRVGITVPCDLVSHKKNPVSQRKLCLLRS